MTESTWDGRRKTSITVTVERRTGQRRAVSRNGTYTTNFDAIFTHIREQRVTAVFHKERDAEFTKKFDCIAGKIDAFETQLSDMSKEFLAKTTEGWTRVYGVVQNIENEINEKLDFVITAINSGTCAPLIKSSQALVKRKKRK